MCRSPPVIVVCPPMPQAIALDALLEKYGMKVDLVIELSVSDDDLRARMNARLVHPPSGRTYSTLLAPPEKEGKDDITGEGLSRRIDDTEATFARRLASYRGRVDEVLEHYKGRCLTIAMDNDLPTVQAGLVTALTEALPALRSPQCFVCFLWGLSCMDLTRALADQVERILAMKRAPPQDTVSGGAGHKGPTPTVDGEASPLWVYLWGASSCQRILSRPCSLPGDPDAHLRALLRGCSRGEPCSPIPYR